MKICFILGTRPEIIKLSPVIRQCVDQKIDHFIIHSNQHYSQNMDDIFFKELELEPPQYNLNVGSGLHGEMTGKILTGVEKILIDEKPDWVLVQGDTNTVMAGALAASKLHIKVGHVEAGLRSYDREMPEETNRIIADHISDALFCPTQKQADILLHEGIDKSKIFVTGNTIVDAVLENTLLLKKHREFDNYQTKKFFLVTAHRPSNVDSKETLTELLNTLTSIATKYNFPFIFPIHPRTKKQIELFNIKINNNFIKLIDPTGYLEMLALEKNSQIIFTDSGGIQEEACILQVPCITLRENTERPETIEVGANILVGRNEKLALDASQKMLNIPRTWQNPFGDGTSSRKIFELLN
ncbi:MAG: UDP-N-acetylglucosamine 2-epimerase (non-hydrolyzing) [bacterium]|nr:UDP-N-acetylglucosamine 2-epimerase (non-hydrolyzing) [bacterium]